MSSPRLVVFDLDGTLVDSSQDLADSVNALLEELGAPALAPDAVTGMVGDGAAVLVRRALVKAGVEVDPRHALARFLDHYERRLLATTQPYPGIVETLEALRPTYSLAVLTNKPAAASVRLLEGLDLLKYFPEVIGGDTPFGRKPDPAGLLALISRARATAATTVLVGDSPIDLATAQRAEAQICLARYGFGFRAFRTGENGFRGDELFIDKPRDLLDLLVRLDRHA